ncbi:hypothetical protein DL546_008147 [Coniochaeta pulveracea]|uniref:Uncharacterized protein n=1 Tax=Coniochaeta pulveracea TaxID=177199 RepID=A0A420YJJ5_9PEZI|nr:hypothetical protein DL546_008147 [Coniochaeta pulveracea]
MWDQEMSYQHLTPTEAFPYTYNQIHCKKLSTMADGSTPITVPPAEVTCVKEGCGTKLSSSAYKCPTCNTVQK